MSAVAALFDDPGLADCIASSKVAGGTVLYEAGDVSKAVYLVRRGLLAVLRPGADKRNRLVGYVRAREYVGEMGVLAGAPRTATVVALRDSIVDMLPAADLLRQLSGQSMLAAELAYAIVRRARGDAVAQPRAQIVLIASVMPGADPVALAHDIADQCMRTGIKAVALARNDVGADDERIDQAEASNALVLLAARHDEEAWLDACRRQVDRILLLGRADTAPQHDCELCSTEPLQANQLVDLVLVRPAGTLSQSAHHWLKSTNATRLFHVDDAGGGVVRLARILTGTSVGLALSGGGARAFAHIGAVRALREAKIELDLVCGTSMGAIVAAGVAAGWDDAELDHRMRAAFVASSPLDDIAFPIVAMTRGHKVENRLQTHFGSLDIADLETPFFCLSANLTSGRSHIHDRGPLTRALRASISLPGVLPPVVEDGQVLVDGGVLRNLPTELLRARHDGTVIGCDVSRSAGLTPAEVMPPPSWLRWWASGAWRRGPPIVSILMRSATVGTVAEIAAARDAADLYVMPDTGMVEIRDWRAYPQAVEAGYDAMRAALEQLDKPVAALRRMRAEGM
jgi:NTE family protein